VARSLWNGILFCGAFAVPVKLFPATESKTVRFHLLHAPDDARIAQRRICPRDGQEVAFEHVVRGFEVAPDRYVVLSKEETEAAERAHGKVIDVEEFVAAGEIDPILYDRPYRLAPQAGAESGYRLLLAALVRSERVGIGRFILRSRESLVSLRPLAGLLGLSTMRFHDELAAPEGFELPEASRRPSQQEVQMAASLVGALAAPFRPEQYHDTHREAVLDLIARKARGEAIEVGRPVTARPSDDLMAALEASLAAVR